MENLSYPIGRYAAEETVTRARRDEMIDVIERTPGELRRAVEGLSDAQLDTPYRPDGWTVRQLVHHVADSHINSYVRFKLALTEDAPTIKAYDEALWAETDDSKTLPVETSLALLDALHERWVALLRGLSDEDLRRAFTHPERGLVTLESTLGLYAWHGPHHVAHVTRLRDRENWWPSRTAPLFE